MPGGWTVSKRRTMELEYILGFIVSMAVLLYLLYALLRPEKF
jgi:K+-transporting ATPase KdpF subunit